MAAARALQMAAGGAGAERRCQWPRFRGREMEAPRGDSSKWWGCVSPSPSDAHTPHCPPSLFPSLIDLEEVFAPGGAQPSPHVGQRLGVTAANVAFAVFPRTCCDEQTTVSRSPASHHQPGRDVDGIRGVGVCPPHPDRPGLGGELAPSSPGSFQSLLWCPAHVCFVFLGFSPLASGRLKITEAADNKSARHTGL